MHWLILSAKGDREGENGDEEKKAMEHER